MIDYIISRVWQVSNTSMKVQAVFGSGIDQVIGVTTDGRLLLFETKSDDPTKSVLLESIPLSIHTTAGINCCIVVLSNKSILLFNSSLEVQHQSSIAKLSNDKEKIVWSGIVQSKFETLFIIITCEEQQSKTSTNYKVYFSEIHNTTGKTILSSFSTLLLNSEVKICSFAANLFGHTLSIATFGDDMVIRITKYTRADLTAPITFESQNILDKIQSTEVHLTYTAQNFLAATSSGEVNTKVFLWELAYGSLQNKLTIREKKNPVNLLFRPETSNLLCVFDDSIVSCFFTFPTLSLASAVGKGYLNPVTPQITKSTKFYQVEKLEWLERSDGFTLHTSTANWKNIEIIVRFSNDFKIVNKTLKFAVSEIISTAHKKPTFRVMSVIAERCVTDERFYPYLNSLLSKKLLSEPMCPSLIPNLLASIKKNPTIESWKLLKHAFESVSDLSEKTIIQVLSLCLRYFSNQKFAETQTHILSIIHSILRLPFNQDYLLSELSCLELPDVKLILTVCCQVLTDRLSASPVDISNEPISVSSAVNWMSLVLDSQWKQICLSDDHEMNSIVDISKRLLHEHIEISRSNFSLSGQISDLIRQHQIAKTTSIFKPVEEYSIELIFPFPK
eukprot:c18596_g1_i2.p1 GENE.c18596_g1_i2~~c18596_g1_i2.p1  ORF type:complete len:617 (-),score=213.82 c18596_g1_i2:24-1874(-)